MARRSDHSRDELYDLALAAARTIVTEQGFAALTARRVAQAMGYTPGTLYNLFANRDDLVLHVNAGTLELLRAALAEHHMTGDPATDLEALLTIYEIFLAGHANLWRMLFQHHLPDGQPLPDGYRDRLNGLLGIIETALAPCFPPGREAERRDTARVLWAGLHGIRSLADDAKLDLLSDRPAGDLSRLLVRRVLAGLKAD